MAKKQATRRKSRRPKLIDMDGHKLTRDQYMSYESALATRMRQGYMGLRAVEVALDDVLHEYRPTKRAEKQLASVYRRTMDAVQYVGSAQKFPWFVHGKLRAAGIEVLRTLAFELYSASTTVAAILEAIAAEDREKLQDWNHRSLIIEGRKEDQPAG